MDAARELMDHLVVPQVRAMQVANKQLTTQFKSKDLDIDRIDAMQDQMADLMEINNEIQESLARQYAVPDDLDEEVTGMHYTDNHTRLIGPDGRPHGDQQRDPGVARTPTRRA
jgi:hypothetical protein